MYLVAKVYPCMSMKESKATCKGTKIYIYITLVYGSTLASLVAGQHMTKDSGQARHR